MQVWKWVLKLLEVTLWAVAVVCLGYYATTVYAQHSKNQQAIDAFYQQTAQQPQQQASAQTSEPPSPAASASASTSTSQNETIHTLPNTDLWSQEAKDDFNNADKNQIPIAMLEIKRLKVNVPVFVGAQETQLDIGAGWLPYTAELGDPNGNIGIAAHRDSWFRALKDIKQGDRINLITKNGNEVYEIDNTSIVTPKDTAVLGHTQHKQLTLITCYPFYYTGNAPYRFIVSARKIQI